MSKVSNSGLIEGNIKIDVVKICDILTPEYCFLENDFKLMNFNMLSCNRFHGD